MIKLDLYKYSKKNLVYKFLIKKILRINVELLKKDFLHFDNIDLEFKESFFYEYYKKNPTTDWVGNINERDHYQSNHNLQSKDEFYKPVRKLESFLNRKIKEKLFIKNMNGKFRIKSMWFTIQKKNENHSIHNHPKSILSGVSYFKIEEKKGGELILYKKDKKITFMPKKNDLVIFNSETMHSVNSFIGESDRIAVAWDAIYSF